MIGRLIALALVSALVGAAVSSALVVRPSPDDDSPEAGFARDMATHHAQAVEMSATLLAGRPSTEVAILAEDIMLTQQAQIGQMRGWLDAWGLPVGRPGPAMAWMVDTTSDDAPQPGPMARMPGMATRADMDRLAAADGVDAERQFLELMIPHHRGGVVMAEAVLARADQPAVRALAQAMIASQGAEIRQMEDLLAAR